MVRQKVSIVVHGRKPLEGGWDVRYQHHMTSSMLGFFFDADGQVLVGNHLHFAAQPGGTSPKLDESTEDREERVCLEQDIRGEGGVFHDGGGAVRDFDQTKCVNGNILFLHQRLRG